MSRIPMLVGLVLLGLVNGCSAYVEDFHYQPHPALADIPATQPGETPPVSAMVSIVGIRRADKDAGIPESVELGMQVENNSAQTVTLDPGSLRLTNGTFVNFPPALVHPAGAINLGPMQAATFSAYFPFPPGKSWDDVDLNWLQASWVLQIDGRTVKQVVNFQRYFSRYYYYRDPYYWDYPPTGFYGGVYIHRRL